MRLPGLTNREEARSSRVAERFAPVPLSEPRMCWQVRSALGNNGLVDRKTPRPDIQLARRLWNNRGIQGSRPMSDDEVCLRTSALVGCLTMGLPHFEVSATWPGHRLSTSTSARAPSGAFLIHALPESSGHMPSADRGACMSMGVSFSELNGFTNYSVPAAVSGGGANMNGPIGGHWRCRRARRTRRSQAAFVPSGWAVRP